jgi:dihydrofolate reductase
MRKIVSFMHISLDGFTNNKKGEIDWIKVDDEMFELAGRMTEEADIALYGRVTYQMMEDYWPTAGDKPNATKHDLEHSKWYNRVPKLVLSKTLDAGDNENVRVIRDHVGIEIHKIKNLYGKNIIIFGSPSVVHSLMQFDLVDEFWLLVNPVLLGDGIPMFRNLSEMKFLKLVGTKVFGSGVIALHYTLGKSIM